MNALIRRAVVLTLAILPLTSWGQNVWINEYHYDNTGVDSAEGVEIAGPAGTDLTGFQIWRIEGSTAASGTVDGVHNLTGVIPDEGCGYGAIWLTTTNNENGPDGYALVNASTTLLDFITYEGIIVGRTSAINGVTGTLALTETGSEVLGLSLQLIGTGTNKSAFTWTGPTNHSRGSLNVGQSMTGCSVTNVAPTLNAIGNKTIGDGGNLSFTVTASDTVDNDAIGLWAVGLPAGSTFGPITNIGGVTNTFNWNPATPAGVYTTTFFAVDKDGTDSETITITVNPQSPPVLGAIGNKIIIESNLLSFGVSATLTDGDAVTLTVSNEPAGSVFSPTNENGTFSWASPAPIGVYTLTFWAVDNDGPDSETITITVNATPPPNTNDIWINEINYDESTGDTNEWVEIVGKAGLSLNDFELVLINGTDGLPYKSSDLADANFTFADESCGYGFFVVGRSALGVVDLIPTNWAAGNNIQNGAPDGVQIKVKGGINVHTFEYEGDSLSVPHDQATTLADLGVNENDTLFLSSGTGTSFASFTWTNTTASVTFGALNPGQSFGCSATNVPPILAAIGNKSITNNGHLMFDVTASDSDNDSIGLWAVGLPAGATFGPVTNIGGVTNTFHWDPATPVGVYTTTFFAVDDDGTDSETITITVTAPPPPPVSYTNIVWINEYHYDNAGTDSNTGVEVAGVAGTDLTGYQIWRIEGSTAASGNVDGVTIIASNIIPDEGCGYGAIWIPTPDPENGPPDGFALVTPSTGLVDFISYEGVIEGTNGILLGKTATVAVAESGLETNMSAQLTGTGTNKENFTWSGPALASAGFLNVGQTITGCTLTNQPPVLDPIGNKSVTDGGNLSFTITASDNTDNDAIGLWATNLPAGATFGPVTNAGGVTNTFTWNPATPAGSYTVYFFASDDDGTDAETITITVNTQSPPVLVAIGNKSVPQGNTLSFGVTATPTDGDVVTLTASNLPGTATFSPTNENGTFSWVSAGPAGTYTTTFWAADNDGAVSETITITVTPPNTNQIWINEFNYDGPGTDTNEWVELVGKAGLTLNDYELVFINGGDGAEYRVVDLAGAAWTFTNEVCDYGFIVVGREVLGGADFTPTNWVASGNIQNGSPDSIQIRTKVGALNVHAVSYTNDNPFVFEDQITAALDLSPDEVTLYLTGTGTPAFASFTWSNAGSNATPGAINFGQEFTCGGGGDTDTDGIPDAWEDANGLDKNNAADAAANTDGDIYNNLQEYLLDFNPGVNDQPFGYTFAQGIGRDFSFNRATNSRVYTVEYNTDALNGSGWNILQDSLTGSNGTHTVDDTNTTDGDRVYRVRVHVP